MTDTNATPACPCGRPIIDNSYLCHRCTDVLERDLGDIPALADEVETTRLRQSRTGGQAIGGGHGSERPLPWDQRPVDASNALKVSLVGWVRIVTDERGGAWPADTLTALSRHLLANLKWLRHRPEVHDAKTEIGPLVHKLRATIDTRPERTYYGPCGSVEYGSDGKPILCAARCPTDLYAHPKATTATCQTCATEIDLTERREWLLSEVEEQLAHAQLLGRALSSLGRPVPDATIRSWVARGRLTPRGHDHQRALYRVGDVLDLLAEQATRQAGRSA